MAFEKSAKSVMFKLKACLTCSPNPTLELQKPTKQFRIRFLVSLLCFDRGNKEVGIYVSVREKPREAKNEGAFSC